jgi:hypothetical protein
MNKVIICFFILITKLFFKAASILREIYLFKGEYSIAFICCLREINALIAIFLNMC